MTTIVPARTLALALALLALVPAGCGKSDEEQFVDEVNEICTESEDDVEAAKDPDTLGAALDEFLADLKAVDPPEDRKADYSAWVASRERAADELKARADDEQGVDAVDDGAGDEQARELGLDACTS